MRWYRTQMSAWMYSMMWPMWKLPLAYGSAVVTKIWRGADMRRGSFGEGTRHFRQWPVYSSAAGEAMAAHPGRPGSPRLD